FTAERFRTIKATYYRIALDFVDSYRNDALINGLAFDQHKEELAVEVFARNLVAAGQSFLDNPNEMPFIPAWNRVMSAVPDILEQICEAVEADQLEFGR
ncbi:MAG: glycosyl transferase, partial [Pseudomonadota bacterium]